MKIVTSWLTKGLSGTGKKIFKRIIALNDLTVIIFRESSFFVFRFYCQKVLKSLINESTRNTLFQVSLRVKQQLFPGS